jgi:lysine 2,3-aminomutase
MGSTGNTDFLYHPREHCEIPLWKNVSPGQWNNPIWQLRNTIKSVDQLKSVIKLSNYQEAEIRRTVEILRSQGKEPLRITPYYASLMEEDPFNPHRSIGHSSEVIDPIFWQSVPTPANLLFPNTGIEGAMKEESRSYGAAYQRYPDRVALFVAGNTNCASYCIHCQRSKSLYRTGNVDKTEIDKGIYYINSNKNINEVLLTGGDALMIGEIRLKYVLEELSKISHLRVIRIATRLPVVLPVGVSDRLLVLIKDSANRYNRGISKYVYFMTQINHYKELTPDLMESVKRINDHGFTIRNQTILLNHVNNNFRVLAETFRRMFWIGIHPYYLLQCHKEKGIIHFITPVLEGEIYMKHLQGWISGITVPRYAANIEGVKGKVLQKPSGHDTQNLEEGVEARISESNANVTTWDNHKIMKYEALGQSSRKEYDEAIQLMDAFIGRKGVFLPKIILVDENGNHTETTNGTQLPFFERSKKAKLLGYKIYKANMPLTNPGEIADLLDVGFEHSRSEGF